MTPNDTYSCSGFWCYTHDDDENSYGKVSRLAEAIVKGYALETGSELTLFRDRASLEWGDKWREQIAESLSGATFFIPIVTPRFFVSNECRNELLTFRERARSQGLTELLLPILYVDVDGLDEDSEDEAKRIIASTQYELDHPSIRER